MLKLSLLSSRFVVTSRQASKRKSTGRSTFVRISSRSAAQLSRAAWELWRVLKKLLIIKCSVSWTELLLFALIFSIIASNLSLSTELLGIRIAASRPPFFPWAVSKCSFSQHSIGIFKSTVEAAIRSLYSIMSRSPLAHPQSILFTRHENINFIHSASPLFVASSLIVSFVCPLRGGRLFLCSENLFFISSR